MGILVVTLLVPAVSLLWFMDAAMRNERLATRQKLAELYRGQLALPQSRLQQYWREVAKRLETNAILTPPSLAFAECVRSGPVESVLILDEQGRVLYPNTPTALPSDFGELEARWAEAGRLEYLRRYAEAARQYDAVARAATNLHASARAVQAQARCLAQAGDSEAVIHIVEEIFGDERYRDASDLQGRSIAANAELLALESMTNRFSPSFLSLAQRFSARLMDYHDPALAAPQRRFLMKELSRLSSGTIGFPTLSAEQMAAETVEHPGMRWAALGQGDRSEQREPVDGFAIKRGARPDVWQLLTPNLRVLGLIHADQFVAASTAASSEHSAADVLIKLAFPDEGVANAFATRPAGPQMPGWQLTLQLKNPELFDIAAGRRAAIYFWTGLLVMAGMAVLALLALRLVRRQMSLARLKNDLAATVSHELKTPLSSMRVLLETLLHSDQWEEAKAREYLQLILQENERLGRLMEAFLTFSRLDRKKYTFQFAPLPARQVIEAAMNSVRGRMDHPDCRWEVEVEEDLPLILADAVTLTTALSNLLDNAYKYSSNAKHIVLRARAVPGSVILSVSDNGIGLAPRERKKIFQPFYQIDQRLSRQGSGCGLGLSIVQFITRAHRGSVSVESRPGGGSTFAISLPIAFPLDPSRKEATA